METVLEPVTTSGLSLSHGAELQEQPALLTSLATALKRAAERSPDKGVRYIRADGTERVQLYPELVTEASSLLAGLRTTGLKPGDKVIFQFQLNEDFVPVFWACMMGGFVPVPISVPPSYDEPHNILAKLENAWGMLEQPLVLAGTSSVAGLQKFSRRQRLENFRVESVGPLRASAPAGEWHPSRPEDPALLLLTSGSTGLPKAVQLHHRNILARSAATAQMDGFDAHDVSMNWMPLDHVRRPGHVSHPRCAPRLRTNPGFDRCHPAKSTRLARLCRPVPGLHHLGAKLRLRAGQRPGERHRQRRVGSFVPALVSSTAAKPL